MDLTRLIDHPELMNKETLYELRNIVAHYPYYQPARLLMLQNIYLLHDTSFDDELHRAAIYMTDRRVLFNLVEGAHYAIKSHTKTETGEDRERHGENRTLSIIDNYLDTTGTETAETEDPQRKPTPADAAIDYVAYLLKAEADDDKETQDEGPQMKGQELIDTFINKEGGKITLQEEPTYTPQIEQHNDGAKDGDDGYFTETLAQIYIKQGRYSKALEIIQRLNLNYPKKNAYFADQIRFLKKLILNNKNNKQEK